MNKLVEGVELVLAGDGAILLAIVCLVAEGRYLSMRGERSEEPVE